MKIKEIMSRNVPLLKVTDSVEKAIQILTKVPQAALPVVNNQGKIVGELHQRELLLLDIGQEEFKEKEGIGFGKLKLLLASKAKTVKDIMNEHELTLSPDDDVQAAAKLLYDEELGTIPIVDKKGKLVGVLTDICVLKHYKKILAKNKK